VKHLAKGVVETREGKMSCEANLSESFGQVRRIRQLQPQGVFGTNYYIGKNRRTDEGIMENVWVIVLKDRRVVTRATNTFAKEAPRKILELSRERDAQRSHANNTWSSAWQFKVSVT